jgi:predicted mannosyl-3-phosphoglycerate phosphatase (HAD superfamily)
MEYTIRIQDLQADEIRELLLEEGNGLDEQQAAALKQFIEDIGGMENALAALAMLDELEKAA